LYKPNRREQQHGHRDKTRDLAERVRVSYKTLLRTCGVRWARAINPWRTALDGDEDMIVWETNPVHPCTEAHFSLAEGIFLHADDLKGSSTKRKDQGAKYHPFCNILA
jgi:hypothetical protein